MKNLKLLSVIIPVYNAKVYLEKYIDRLLLQMDSNIEVIFVDDGSTDDTYSFLKRKCSENFIVVKKENEGVSAARNYGLSLARGKWVGFLDADDFWLPNAVQELICTLSILDENDEFVIFKYISVYNEEYQIPNNIEYSKKLMANEVIRKIFCDNNIKGFVWNKIFRKDILDKYKIQFNEEIAMNEDLLFCFQYFMKANNGYYLDKYLYAYVQHKKSSSIGIVTSKHLSSIIAFKEMKEMTGIEEYQNCISTAYIDVLIYLLKKCIRFGCSDNSVKKQLKVAFRTELEHCDISLNKLSKSQRVFFYIFKKSNLIYSLMRISRKEGK